MYGVLFSLVAWSSRFYDITIRRPFRTIIFICTWRAAMTIPFFGPKLIFAILPVISTYFFIYQALYYQISGHLHSELFFRSALVIAILTMVAILMVSTQVQTFGHSRLCNDHCAFSRSSDERRSAKGVDQLLSPAVDNDYMKLDLRCRENSIRLGSWMIQFFAFLSILSALYVSWIQQDLMFVSGLRSRLKLLAAAYYTFYRLYTGSITYSSVGFAVFRARIQYTLTWPPQGLFQNQVVFGMLSILRDRTKYPIDDVAVLEQDSRARWAPNWFWFVLILSIRWDKESTRSFVPVKSVHTETNLARFFLVILWLSFNQINL